jgi:hypothetical protein
MDSMDSQSGLFVMSQINQVRASVRIGGSAVWYTSIDTL